MFEPQRYPEVKLVPGKEIVRPYDVAAWTMPMMMGVDVETGGASAGPAALLRGSEGRLPRRPRRAPRPAAPRARRLVNAALRSTGAGRRRACGGDAGGARAGRPGPSSSTSGGEGRGAEGGAPDSRGTPAIASPPSRPRPTPLRAPRVGLYKGWNASMDEGWTRWILEQYGFEPKSLDPKAVRAGRLRESPRRHRPSGRGDGDDPDRKAEARRGRDALLGRAPARVPGGDRKGRGEGAQGVRGGRRDDRRPVAGLGVPDLGVQHPRPERPRTRAARGVPVPGLATPGERERRPPGHVGAAAGGRDLRGRGRRLPDGAAGAGAFALGPRLLSRRRARRPPLRMDQRRGASSSGARPRSRRRSGRGSSSSSAFARSSGRRRPPPSRSSSTRSGGRRKTNRTPAAPEPPRNRRRASLLRDREDRSRREGVELGGVHRLHRGGTDAERSAHGRPDAVLERVLPDRKPLEEEVRGAVADLLVVRKAEVPLPARGRGDRFEARAPRVAELDVLRLVLRPEGELHLHLVSRAGEPRRRKEASGPTRAPCSRGGSTGARR